MGAFSVLFVFGIVLTLAISKSYDGYAVFSVRVTTRDQLTELFNFQKTNSDVDFWDRPNLANNPFNVMVGPDTADRFKQFTEDHGITSDVVAQNAGSVFRKELQRNMKRSKSRMSHPFDHYLRFEEISALLKKLAAEHPHLMTLESVGKSTEGRDLWLVKISSTGFDGSKPIIWMDANMHAREWIASMSVLFMIYEMVVFAEMCPEMYAADWMIMPMVNPDGYEQSHTKDRMWRITMAKNNQSECAGVDINRNFPFQWDTKASVSDEPCTETYRGPRPESEPEVRAMTKLLRETKNIKLYLSIHAYGNSILYPFGFDLKTVHPNRANLISLGNRVADAIKKKYPTCQYFVGNAAELYYPASGASDDFAAGEVGIEYAYTLELSRTDPGSFRSGFDLEIEKAITVSKEIFEGYREFARWAGEKFN